MSHARSGLPPLNLEPFDPSALYAAARSPRREKHQPNYKEKRSGLFVGLVAALLVACAGAAVYFLI